MCGIFAVIGLTGDPLHNRKRVYGLSKRIRHRGPDSYKMDVSIKEDGKQTYMVCLLYTSPSPRDKRQSRMPSSA